MKYSKCQGDLRMSCINSEMEKIKAMSPFFYRVYEDANLDAVRANDAVWKQLFDAAPNDFVRGLLMGRALMSTTFVSDLIEITK